MKKLAIGIMILAMATSAFAGGKKDPGGLTIKPGVLMIGVEVGYPPMEYYGPDGKTPMGFDIEMAKAVASRMGLKVEFIDTAWDGIFPGVETNRYDAIISSVTVTPARTAAHNFSKPYIANTLAMVVLKNSLTTIRSPEECAGFDVSFQQGTTADYYMQRLAQEHGLKFNPRGYEKVMNCFDELKMGRVDVIITDLLVAYDYIALPNSPFEIVWTSHDPDLFGICIKKGNDNLTNEINLALEEMFADGTMNYLSQQIFGMDLVTAARQHW